MIFFVYIIIHSKSHHKLQQKPQTKQKSMTPARCIIPLGKSERDCGCTDAHSETPQFIKKIVVHQHHFVIETTDGEEITVHGDRVYPDLIRYLPVYIGFIEGGSGDNGSGDNGTPTMLMTYEGAPLSLVLARQLLAGLHEEMQESRTQQQVYSQVQPRAQPRTRAPPSHEQLRRSAMAGRLAQTSNRSVGFASELTTTDVGGAFGSVFDDTFSGMFGGVFDNTIDNTFDDIDYKPNRMFDDVFDSFNIDDNYIKYDDDFWNRGSNDANTYANTYANTHANQPRDQTRDQARARIIAQLREQARHADAA
jgi:hypothetical protein